MLILHQFKLMTSNGFGIPLILVEKIKRDIASDLGRSSTNPPVGLKTTNELI